MAGSYLLCGTPRTGSTLLCGLLASTGVAGRPESYFRAADAETWARRLGVPADDPARFAAAVRAAGSTPNGVFAARVMWGSMDRAVAGGGPGRDVDRLTAAFGPLRFVHLRRADVVGQAVSWARAEQTGHWQAGDPQLAEPRFDRARIDELVRTIADHHAAWTAWFADNGVEPYGLTYEGLVADPHRAIRELLDHLGLALPAGWRPAPRERRQADEVNADWVRRYLMTIQ